MDRKAIAICLPVALWCAAGLYATEASIRNPQARAFYQKAIEYGDKGLWDPAILELNRARQLEADNPQILIQLGIAHGELREWKQAVASLRKAVAIAPASVEAHYNLALTLDRADPGKGAGTPEYRQALKLNPRHVDSLINLAINAGDQDAAEARRLFARAIRLDPKNAKARLNLALLLKRESED